MQIIFMKIDKKLYFFHTKFGKSYTFFILFRLKIDFFYTFVILKDMKTAISLPDSIFLEAEETARNMGITRSMLFHNALTEYLKKHNHQNITEKLNEVYSAEYYKEDFAAISNAAIEGIRGAAKDEAR